MSFSRLVVCYIPAIDMRRLDLCPHIGSRLDAVPTVRFTGYPCSDCLPTLLTGTDPGAHGMWGPRLRTGWRRRSVVQTVADLLPDVVTTGVQGTWHLIGRPVDVATMPPRRRRRFDWMRLNYKLHKDPGRVTGPINGVPTVLSVLGTRARFIFEIGLDGLDRVIEAACTGDATLEFIDIHGLDYALHWHMQDAEVVATSHRKIDAFVAALQAKCARNGAGFVLLSDHGSEPVTQVIDLARMIEELDLPPESLDVFIENSRATFWFHDERARTAIETRLSDCGSGAFVRWQDLARRGVHFPDNRYGDACFFPEPGGTFFPNDFHHPLAARFFGRLHPHRRPATTEPWHKAEHGYWTDCGSEAGFIALVDDEGRAVSETCDLTDIAPTLLALLGHDRPATMRGRVLFEARRPASAGVAA